MPDDASIEAFGLDKTAEPAAPPADLGRAASGSRSRSFARRAPLIAAAAVAVLGAGAWGANWWTVGRFIEGTNDAFLDADQVVAAPKVQGYVSEVLVSDNQQVRAGQPLVRIDPRPYQAALDQAVAAIAARQADVQAAQAQISQQTAHVGEAKAQLVSARTAETLAASEVERYRPLVQSGADTPEKLAQLSAQRDQSAAAVAANAAATVSAQRQVATQAAQIGQAEAQLKAAQANAEQARLNLQDTVVTSSIAGRVGDRAVRVGQFVGPGARLMAIVPVSDVYLTANFKETQIAHMRPGQPVSIRVDALGGRELKGVVESFAPGTGARFALLPPENATGNFTKVVQRVPVRVRVLASAEDRKRLLPGLSVTAKVDTRGGQ
jgi:membrane fusion protein (multidrug efflux system)